MRLIDSDKIPYTDLNSDMPQSKVRVYVAFKERIDEMPTIEAELVRHGTWIFSPDHAEGICTRCNFKIYGRPYNNTYMIVPYNYCPNCGAKMEE